MAFDLGHFGDPARATPPTPPAPPAPRRPRPPARALVVLVAAVLVAAADLVVAGVGRDGAADRGPAAAATAFFDAVRRHDAAAARAMLSPRLRAEPLLSAAALAAGGPALPDPVVTVDAATGDDARVRVVYAVAVPQGDFGLPVACLAVLVLHRTHTGLLGASTRWTVTGGLPELSLRSAPFEPAATVSGVEVPLTGGAADVAVFPGSVPVSVPARLLGGAYAVSLAVHRAGDSADAIAVGPATSVEAAIRAGVRAALASSPLALSGPGVGTELDSERDELSADGRSVGWVCAVTQTAGAARRQLAVRGTATLRSDGSVAVSSGPPVPATGP